MHRIVSIILFSFLLGFLFPNFCFSQYNEPAIDTVRMIDSANQVSGYQEDVEVKVVEKKSLLFSDATTDTAALKIRLLQNDTIAKMKLQSVYQFHPKNDEVKKQNKTDNKSLVSNNFLEFLFWFVAIGFLVAVIVVYALDGNVNIFSRGGRKVRNIIEEEDVFAQNIFDLDFSKLIQQATAAGEFNKATRLGFLKILTLLSNEKIIKYSIEKTNFDYQFELINTAYYQNFLLVANYYEYAWYSGIVITENQYGKIMRIYQQFEQQLN